MHKVVPLMHVRSIPRFWAAALVLWIAVAFLLVNGWLLYMHPDEELSYRSTDGDLAYTLDFQMSVKDNQAPLWFVTFWGWRQLVGDAEYTSRIFSVFCTMLALAITYPLGRLWFRSGLAGLLAPLLLLATDLFFNYALDIRPYPLVMFCAALSMWAFTLWIKRRTIRSAVIYGLTITLLLYVHYLLIFLVIVQGIYYIFSRRPTLESVKQGTLALGVGICLWLPWFPTFVNQVVGLRNIEQASGTARGAAGIGVSTQATTPATITFLLDSATNGLVWLYAAILLLGVFLLWRNRFYWLALAWAFGVPLVALAANLAAAVYAPRFVSHAMLGLGLALAAVFVALPRRLGLTAAALLITANLLTFPSAIPVRVPYRDLYAELSTLGRAGDVILFAKGGEDDWFVHWQYGHYLAFSLQAGITTDITQAESARRIWFVTDSWFDADVRGVFDSLEPTHPVQRVLGQCDNSWCYLIQLMEAPPLTEAHRFDENIDFWGADIDQVTESGIATRLWWRVEATPSLDYSFSLRLVNASGEVVAQNDGAINHYGAEIVQTSQMTPDKIYIDWRTITLPAELSAGVYTLQLVVYQSWDGTRLLLPDGSDFLTINTLMLS